MCIVLLINNALSMTKKGTMLLNINHFLRSFSGKCHSLPGVYRSRSQSSFLLCILSTKFFWLPCCWRSVKKESTAFMATRRVETGQMTQLQPYSLKVLISMYGVLPNSVMLASRKTLLLWLFNSLATIWNSSAVSSPSGKIISAPALMQLFDREMHSSRPQTPFASVLAQITNSPSDTFTEVSRAILILSTICWTEISSLPLRWPHRLGKTWSSMCRPEAPEQKKSLTVLAHISPSPKPVSASAMTGRLENVETSLMTEQNSLRDLRPISGTPDEAVSAPPETQRALNPCCAASLAMSPLKQPGIMMQSLVRSCLNSLHLVIRFILDKIINQDENLQLNSTTVADSHRLGVSNKLKSFSSPNSTPQLDLPPIAPPLDPNFPKNQRLQFPNPNPLITLSLPFPPFHPARNQLIKRINILNIPQFTA